jgi:hypothetical protein
MAYLNKEDLLLKLAPFGVKSVSGLNRLIREQQLPVKSFLTMRKLIYGCPAVMKVW